MSETVQLESFVEKDGEQFTAIGMSNGDEVVRRTRPSYAEASLIALAWASAGVQLDGATHRSQK